MSILAIIQAILNLPATLDSLWAKINALEAAQAAASKAASSAAFSKAQADTENAQTTEDYKKAVDEEAKALGSL